MRGLTCLITGATDGIGKEVAIELAKKGCNLILIGRNKEKGEKVVEKIIKIDDKGRLVFSRKSLIDMTEGWKPPPKRDRNHNSRDRGRKPFKGRR